MVSKFPLPLYRFDLDDKRPQREVLAFDRPLLLLVHSAFLFVFSLAIFDDSFHFLQVIVAPGLQKRVDTHLVNYLSGKPKSTDVMSRSSSNASIATEDSLFEQPEPLTHTKTALEKIFWKRSQQMYDKQRNWQVHLPPEIGRMISF